MNVFDLKDSFVRYENVKTELIVQMGEEYIFELSIVIPTYNRPEKLKVAIESAVAQNTTRFFEVVVIDNSDDPVIQMENKKTVEFFESANIKLYRNNKNIGMFGNWNRGVQLAKGEWLTILNDDDELDLNWIEAVMAARNGKSLVGVASEISGEFPKDGVLVHLRKKIKSMTAGSGLRKMNACEFYVAHPFYGTLGVLFNRQVIMELGGYDESLWPSADYAISVNYFIKYGAVSISETLAVYNWGENESSNIKTREGFRRIGKMIRDAWLERAGVKSSALRNICTNMMCIREEKWSALRFDSGDMAPAEFALSWLSAYFTRLVSVPINAVACIFLRRGGTNG